MLETIFIIRISFIQKAISPIGSTQEPHSQGGQDVPPLSNMKDKKHKQFVSLPITTSHTGRK